MEITLKQLSISNFKGVKNEKYQFHHETDIYGANGTGKTTLVDAFTWLLFGKDSNDRKDFSIKPLDLTGKPTDKLEIEVSAVLQIDDSKTTIKRNYREKWVKKRGEEEPEFGGNETIFSWNEVPLSQKEFQEKINGIVSENIFKIVTNPLYFNTLKWQDKRSILLSIVGGQSDLELCNNLKYKELCSILESGKTLEEFKKELSAKTKKLRDEMKLIPSRIDEASKSIKEVVLDHEKYGNVDINTALQASNIYLKDIEEQIKDSTKGQKAEHEAVTALQKQAFEVEKKLREVENRIEVEIAKESTNTDSQIAILKNQIFHLENEINVGKDFLSIKSKSIEEYEAKVKLLREDFANVQQKTLEFKDDSFVCPTCKRVHDEDDIESQKAQMLINFNQTKAEACTKIRAEGVRINQQIEGLKQTIEVKNKSIAEQNEKLIELKNQLKEVENDKIKDLEAESEFKLEEALFKNQEYQILKFDYEGLMKSINERPAQEEIGNSNEARKAEIQQEIDGLKALKVQVSLNNIQEARIQELQKEMSSHGAELNKLEKMEFLVQEFTKEKITSLEQKVNAKFDFVNFKMFDTLINGGETETCEILVNGVPFNDANTAGKAHAGIDIINTLSEHYKCFAPIWIDNRESVTAIQPTKSQIINLFVSPEHKKLTIHDTSSI